MPSKDIKANLNLGGEEFTKNRIKELNNFLTKVLNHRVLKYKYEVSNFLIF